MEDEIRKMTVKNLSTDYEEMIAKEYENMGGTENFESEEKLFFILERILNNVKISQFDLHIVEIYKDAFEEVTNLSPQWIEKTYLRTDPFYVAIVNVANTLNNHYKFDLSFRYPFSQIDIEDKINTILSYKSKNNNCIFSKEYFEILIDCKLENLNLDDVHGTIQDLSKPHFKLGAVSNDFLCALKHTFSMDFDPFYFFSLKIYYPNNNFETKDNDKLYDNFYACLDEIFFNLNKDYELPIKILEFEELNKKLEHVHIDYFSDGVINAITDIKYNKDLLSLYNQACFMDENRFKFLAFYQILESLFEETFFENAIHNTRTIIQSGWNSNKDEDIKKLISLVAIINSQTESNNDKNKLRLVIDKYLFSNTNKTVFIETNKLLIDTLSQELYRNKHNPNKGIPFIKNRNEIFTCKIYELIYYIRNECAHNKKNIYSDDDDDVKKGISLKHYLKNYITLIQSVAERVVMNYKR